MPTTAQLNPDYQVSCDSVTGLCTAKLKVSTGRAYAIPAERRAPWVEEKVKKAPKDSTGQDAEYLGMGFQIDIREIDEAKRVVPFVASTPTIDRYGDVIEQAGWILDFYKRNPIGLFAHDSRSLPVAKAVNVGIVNGNLFTLLQFAKKDEYDFADTVFRMILGGYLNTVSVGFIPLEFKYRYEEVAEGEDPKPWPVGRIYTKSELLETSVVPVPANPEALVVGRSFVPEKKYVAAFRAIELSDDKSDAGRKQVCFEKCEHSYFAVSKKAVFRYGTTNPTDTKDINAHPFLAVGEGNAHLKISASSEVSAKDKIIASSTREGFLCELVGADAEGDPVYRSIFAISEKEISPKIENPKMIPNSGNAHGASGADARSVVPFHAYPLASSDAPWDASKEMNSTDKPADWRKMSTIVLNDGENKSDFKLPHHRGPGAKFATVRRGVANALARANQVKGASASDKAGARKHLLKHVAEFHKDFHGDDSKEFDPYAFESELNKIEAFRDAVCCEEGREMVTRAMVEYALNPHGRYAGILSFALAYSVCVEDAARKNVLAEFAKAFPGLERKFTNQAMNKKLVSAHKKMSAAKSELDSAHAEAMDMLGQACDFVGQVIGSSIDGKSLKDAADGDPANPTPAASHIGDSSVQEKIAASHEHARSAKKVVRRMADRYRSYMQDAIDHLDAILEYVSPDDSDDPDDDGDDDSGDGSGGGTDPDDGQDKQDDPPYTQGPNAEADGQAPPDQDNDKAFAEIATNLSGKASNDSGNKTGNSPAKEFPPASADSALIELLESMGGTRSAS